MRSKLRETIERLANEKAGTALFAPSKSLTATPLQKAEAITEKPLDYSEIIGTLRRAAEEWMDLGDDENGGLVNEAADAITALVSEKAVILDDVRRIQSAHRAQMDLERRELLEAREALREAKANISIVVGANGNLTAALQQISDMGPMSVDDQRWRIAREALTSGLPKALPLAVSSQTE
jgi:hypothetical protein